MATSTPVAMVARRSFGAATMNNDVASGDAKVPRGLSSTHELATHATMTAVA